jgi:hypothetical protein
MLRYLVTVALVLAMLAGWVAVQRLARRFARRHPEFGEFKEDGGECCGACLGEACDRKDSNNNPPGRES